MNDRIMSQPQIYLLKELNLRSRVACRVDAERILNVCKFYVEVPLCCLSGWRDRD